MRHHVLLLMEELLLIHAPFLKTAPLDLTLTYSEKKDLLELVLESEGVAAYPLDSRQMPDDLGLKIITGLAEDIEYRTVGARNIMTVNIKKG